MFEKLLDLLFIKRKFTSKKEYQQLLLYIIEETSTNSMLAVGFIIVFEIFMIFYTIIGYYNNMKPALYFYLIAYVLLLVTSVIGGFLIRKYRKDLKNNYWIVIKGSQIYSVIIMLWAVMITVLDMITLKDYSLIVFMTIMIIMPVVTYIDPFMLIVQNIAGSILIGGLVLTYSSSEIRAANFINFLVFATMATATGFAYTYLRIMNYKKHAQLLNINSILKEASEKDFLSGLYNRNKLNEVSQHLWKDCLENKITLACILCDVDNFKQINDDYGHQEGDQWIRETAGVLMDVVTRENAYCFRYGGEEFLVVIPGITMQEAQEMAEQIRVTFEQIRVGEHKHKATISCGVYCGIPSARYNIEKFYAYADDNLYRAKAKGKNQIF